MADAVNCNKDAQEVSIFETQAIDDVGVEEHSFHDDDDVFGHGFNIV